MHILTSTFSLTLLIWLTGCTTEPIYLPDGGPTSKEVFEGANGTSRDAVGTGELNPVDLIPYEQNATAWSRDRDNETEQLFPTIPNHQLHGYVFPHVTGKGHPVPGYTTGFFLYDKVHFALPGEVPVANVPPRFRR